MALLNSSLARWILGFTLAGVIALLAIVGTSVWLASRTVDNVAEVERARKVRKLSLDILDSALNAETGQRGFLLTGERSYLQPYETARMHLRSDLRTLRELLADDPAASRSFERLSGLLNDAMAMLSETVELATKGEREAAIEIVRTDRGKKTMDEIRTVHAELAAKTEARVADVLGDLESSATTLERATITGGVLIVIFAAGVFWTVAGYTKQLDGAKRDVESLNVGLEERVAERTYALTRANEEIQRFAYIVSHDLRAPLVNIMGFASELEAGTETLKEFVANGSADENLAEAARVAANDDLPEAVRFIRASTTKMDGLINAILKLSREGRRELNSESVDLGKLIANAAAAVQHQLDEAGVQIKLPSRELWIESDRLALEQVVGNLIDNAVKYLSPERTGEIAIRTEELGARVQITVKDNGRGIREEDHERIFELFRRSGAQDRPGDGIGLAHVRALVRRLGGDITVDSRLGEGAAFQVDLPKKLRPTWSSRPL